MKTEPPDRGFHNLTRKELWGTIIGLQLTLLLAALDQTIVSTAMPRIIAELNGFDRYAWVTTAYLLTSTAALPIFGRLSDMYGRKWILLAGAALFVFASALCGAAGSVPWLPGDGMTQLIIFRGLQGIAGGIIFALTFTVLGDLFTPAERGKYQGLFSAVFAISSVLGPAIGGFITDNFSWRWVFYVNLPVGLIALTVLYFAFPHIVPHHQKHALDIPGVLTLLGWVTTLLLALTWIPILGITSTPVLLSFAATVILFAAFIYVELHDEEPLIPLSMFKNSIMIVSSFSLLMTGVGMFAILLFSPLFIQTVLGLSATESGSLITSMTLTMTGGSILSGQLVSRVGKYKWIALTGLGLMCAGLILMSTLTQNSSPSTVVIYLVVSGGGLGLLMPLYTLIVQNASDPRMMGIATSSTQFFRSIGATLGAAIFSSIMLSQYHQYFHAGLPANIPAEVSNLFDNPIKIEQINQHLSTPPQVSANQMGYLMMHMKISLSHAIDTIFMIAAILVGVAFCVNFFLKELPLHNKPRNIPGAPTDPELVIQ